MLDQYKFRTSYEMKKCHRKNGYEQLLWSTKICFDYRKISITPNELPISIMHFKFQLPQSKDEVALSKIAMYPKLTEAHKDEIINKLKK